MLRWIPHPRLRLLAGLSLFLGPTLLVAGSAFGSNGQLIGITLLATVVSLFLPRSIGRRGSDD